MQVNIHVYWIVIKYTGSYTNKYTCVYNYIKLMLRY